MFAAFSRGHIRTVTAFHPHWNQVPSLLEPSSTAVGTGFHPYWNRKRYIPRLLPIDEPQAGDISLVSGEYIRSISLFPAPPVASLGSRWRVRRLRIRLCRADRRLSCCGGRCGNRGRRGGLSARVSRPRIQIAHRAC